MPFRLALTSQVVVTLSSPVVRDLSPSSYILPSCGERHFSQIEYGIRRITAASISTPTRGLPSHPILHVHISDAYTVYPYQTASETTLTLTTYNYRPPSRTDPDSEFVRRLDTWAQNVAGYGVGSFVLTRDSDLLSYCSWVIWPRVLAT
ncbi:hypothetical protein BGW80DRAFT_1339076 [Lactifluus volemus]|nr:hypothetical protein BGW80DRAFT_1339076 [Lactifluus volemus]